MKNSQFDQVIRRLPRCVAVFEVTKVPPWAAEFLTVGEQITWVRGDTFVAKKGQIGLGTSYIKFVEYRLE